MTILEFFEKWNGKGLDFDSAYGFQCVDVFKQYNKDVIGGPSVSGNAIDYWTKYPTDFYTRVLNTIDNYPKIGDVMIWGTAVGVYGHIGICQEADKNDFTSFDQNWPKNVDAEGNGLGVCHFQPHTYNGIVGWLEPKNVVTGTPSTPTIDPDKIRVDVGGDYGVLEVGAIRSKLNDLTRDLGTAQDKSKQFDALMTALITEWDMKEGTTMADIIAESRLLHDSQEAAGKLREAIEGITGPLTDDTALITALQGLRIDIEKKDKSITDLQDKLEAANVPAGYKISNSWTLFGGKYLVKSYKKEVK